MPSDRRQINVRLDETTETLLDQLGPAISRKLGIVVSQSDLFRMGLHALRDQYLSDRAAEPAKSKKKSSR